MSRRERILSKLKAVVHDLSGVTPGDLDPDVSFIDMGFDSLFLTQASLGFKRALGVRVTFRQLFDEAPTLGALATYIDGALPDDASVEAPEASGNQTPQSSGSPTVGAGGLNVDALLASLPTGAGLAPDLAKVDDAGALQRILALQLQSTTSLLAALSGVPVSQDLVEGGAGSRSDEASAEASREDQGDQQAAEPKKASVAHGPFREIDTSTSEFSETQRTFLESVVDRYVQRTSRSKALTEQHRSAFADPRAVAGFRQDWKELTYPLAAERSKGARMIDIDGNEYVDAVSGFGAVFFGHAPDFVVEAVDAQLHRTLDYGPQSTIAGEVAELVCEMTGQDRAAFCNTGSEAVLAAMRMARTATGCDTIVTFNGDYHGIFDEVLVRRQDFGSTSRNVPVAPGIPRNASQNMVVLDYGDPASLDRIRDLGGDLAGVLVEPVQSRRPELQPREFLHGLRALCTELEIPLIFDEIITGFRLAPGGAQEWFGVDADIAAYGKVVGGGMPIGIVAGKRDFMDALDGGGWQYGDDSFPEAGVTYFAGTFIRHPLSLAAVHSVLRHLKEQGPGLQLSANARTTRLALEVNDHFDRTGIPIRIVHCGSVFLPRFGGRAEFNTIFHRLLHLHGLHIWEGRPGFLTTEHTEADIDQMIDAFKNAAEEMVSGGFLEATFPSQGAEEAIPFTASQEEIWVATQMGGDATRAYNEPVRIDLEGPLDKAALRYATRRLITRHDALRSTVDPTGEALRVHAQVEVPIDFEDLREDAEPEASLQERIPQVGSEPFDLAAGPLVRFHLFQLADDHHALLMTVHHIACDGWSISIALRDLSTLYSAAITGRTPEIGTAMSLSEYRAWYDERRTSEEAAEAERFWLDVFEELPPVTNLPVDHDRPEVKTYNGSRDAVVVDAEVGAGLQAIAADRRCTLFTVVFATYNVLLHKLTGESDLVVGVPSAGQALLGENSLVAHCVNYLPIRTQIDADGSFSDYVDALRDGMLDANSYSDITYGTLIKQLPLPRDRSRTPLLTAAFNLDPALTGLDFHGLEWRYVPMPRRFCKLDLAVNVVEEEGELVVEVDYNTDLIDSSTAGRWVELWETMMRAVVADPTTRITELTGETTPGAADQSEPPLRTPPAMESAPPRNLWFEDSTSSEDSPIRTVHGLIEACVDRWPNGRALSDEDDLTLTYHELDERSNRLAHHLIELGVSGTDVVAIDLPRSVETVIAMLAIYKAGAAYLPLDDHIPDDRIAFMLADTEARAVVTSSDRIQRSSAAPVTVQLDADEQVISARASTRPDLRVTPDALAYVIYTSGTTGTPKGVEVTHANVLSMLWGLHSDIELKPEVTWFVTATFAFDASVTQLFAPLASGGHALLVSERSVRQGEKLQAILDQVTGEGVVNSTPAVFRTLMDTQWSGGHNLIALCGGEALPLDLAKELASRFREVWNLYGPTETTGHTTSWKLPGDPQTVSLGTAITTSRIYLLDPNRQPVPPGVMGEIYVGGTGVAKGYRNRAKLTNERFLLDPFSGNGGRMYRTGDLARQTDDGTLEYAGRTDDQVKIRGFRIELGEVESILRTHAAVQDAAARVVELGTVDARLVAYVVYDSSITSIDVPTASDLRAFMRNHVPDYMVPGAIVELDALPLTPRGKIDRNALKDPFATTDEAKHEEIDLSEAEQYVATLWQEILGIDGVSRHDNFFEVGGHSLLAVRAVARLEQDTGVYIEPRTFFIQTLAQVAAAIEPSFLSRPTGSVE